MLKALKKLIGDITPAKVLAILLAASIMALLLLNGRLNKIRQDRDRYQGNYRSLETGMVEIQTRDSLKGIRIRELELNRQELKDYYEGELARTLKDMDIRLRKMESFTNTAIETTNNINTIFKDTLVSDTVRLERLSYRSQWFDIDITKSGPEALIKAVSRDSLIQVVHWYREGPWLTRWARRKEYQQDIISANPDSRITYSRYIVPEKRRAR